MRKDIRVNMWVAARQLLMSDKVWGEAEDKLWEKVRRAGWHEVQEAMREKRH